MDQYRPNNHVETYSRMCKECSTCGRKYTCENKRKVMLNAIVPNVNAEEELLNRLKENLCNITKSKMNKRF